MGEVANHLLGVALLAVAQEYHVDIEYIVERLVECWKLGLSCEPAILA
jgi:hypothetical protein